MHKFPFLEFSPSFISFQLSSSPCGVPAIDRECLADHEACARTAQPKNGNLCHPPGERRYIHIDSLFSTQVEWDLIETMLPDMLRVALSVNVTHVAARQSMSEYHIRYGGYGGIGYYLVADSYIALFSRFSTCGAWEGHYILDFIDENKSDVRPDTIHADTQGQSHIREYSL